MEASTPEPSRTGAPPATPPKDRGPGAAGSGATGAGAQEEVEEFFFLQLNTHIVGVQHNKGEIGDGECAELVRKGATGLQVVNSGGAPLGWISKDIAPTVCPVFDKCPGIRPEVLIPRGSKQKFKVPVNIAFCGPREFREALAELAAELKKLKTSRAGSSVVHVPDGILVEELDAPRWKEASGGLPPGKSAVLLGSRRGKGKQQDVSKCFEDLYAGAVKYEEMPLAPQPQGVATRLLEHQLKALHWAVTRERRQSVSEAVGTSASGTALFWKRASGTAGRGGFCNTITNACVDLAPELPRGGLLCDDMGLGKTITMLACVAAGAPGRPTLVVCPLSVMPGWAAQAEQHCPSLRVATFHGQEKHKVALSGHDVILTTFQTLVADVEKGHGSLLQQSWHRLIVDEAHELRNFASRQTRAVLKVAERCEVVWGLTGTPIQNRVEDAFSLVALLKINPFCEKKWFNRCIMRLVKQGNPLGFARLSMLLSAFVLRRRKDQMVPAGPGQLRPVLELPPKTERLRLVELSSGDRRAYDGLWGFAAKRVGGMSQDEVGQRSAEILVLLLRLRQFCCSPTLLPAELLAELQKEAPDLSGFFAAAKGGPGVANLQALLRELASQADHNCAICLSHVAEGGPVITRCGHAFHSECIRAWLARHDSCPLCKRAPVEVLPWAEEPAAPAAPGALAKVDAVMEEVAGGEQDSVVVFSQFRQMLLLLEERLKAGGVSSVLIDGSALPAERQARVAAFQAGKVRVALCSLKAAGAGLNLTRGNKVIFSDPWWSPAVEAQAADRCHRIGQHRPVDVVRLVVRGSIEEKIRVLQEQKLGIMEGIYKSKEELRSDRVDMVMQIFKGPWVRRPSGGPASERPPKRRRGAAGASGAH